MTRAALALLLALCAGAAMAQTYAGTARVVDGDGLRAGAQERIAEAAFQ